jgi:predicted house-cleaning noncanonical NTP pyrophosphatase (MazG superfamily)
MDTITMNKPIHKYDLLEKVILGVIYFSGGKISKTKLAALIYLLSEKIEDLKYRIDPYIFIKTKTMWDTSLNIIVDGLDFEDHLVYDLANEVELRKKAYEKIHDYLNDCTKEELEAIKEIVAQYKDLSDEALINLILENLKHT